MNNKRVRITAIVIVLSIAVLACGTTSTSGGEVVSTAGGDTQAAPSEATTHNIGDVIQTSDQTVILNSADIVGGNLVANFTVENRGSSSIDIGPVINFEARDAEGTKLELEIFDCPAGNMQSRILAGDKLKGNICWKGLTTNTARIYYTPVIFSSTIIVWDVK